MKFKNLSLTYEPKGKDPFTGQWNNKYLVPALKDQGCDKEGETNVVIVTCSPQFNGVYRYPAEKTATYKKWNNGKVTCLYVPREDCTFETLESIKNEEVRDAVKLQQSKWYNNKVKGRDYTYKKDKPEWMLK